MSEADDKKASPATKKPAASDDARTHLILDSVWLVDDEEQEEAAKAPVGQQVAGRTGAASDDARTHLILDPASLEDDTVDGGVERAVPKSEVASDAQPTHLFIDSARVQSERARLAEAPAPPSRDVQQATGTTKGATVEERTRLMLGPITLKDELMVALARAGAKPSWLGEHVRRLGLWVDDRMHDRWSAALALVAVVCGILPALMEEPSFAASGLTSIGLFVGLAAFAMTWLAKLQNRDGNGDLRAAGARFRAAARLLALDARELERPPSYLKLFFSGQVLILAGLAGLIGASVCSLMSWASGIDDPPSVFRLPSGLLLLLGVSLVHFSARSAIVAPATEELGESVAAATKLAPLVDLSGSLPPSFIEGHTALHRILIALSQWRQMPWPDQAGYRAALERHFQRHLPACRIEREKWIGRSRSDGVADLVIDDMVLIQITHGFDPTIAARAVSQLNDLARTWAGKPMLLAIFDAPHEAVFQSAATLSLVELHERLPLVTVRMPTLRG
jgi:hypothetical protein